MGILTSVKKVVGTVAPLLGASLGGPLGGVALKFMADKFTGGDTGKVEDFILSASPDDLVELKKAEMEYKRYIEELGVKRSQLEVEDRESARDLAKARGTLVQAGISFSYTVGYFTTLFIFVFGKAQVAPEHATMIQVLISALAAPQLQILNFWFGSSQGSKEKTSALERANGHKPQEA